ncbi:MAG: hypothetical protein COX43_03795 [Parcubacteria group bacterium CG23_combo_of_CG06-09_8_20_14_all_35_9]|nr:MAG: hypothetical protein COX43_03795 [Parcubacteria group bacterium CG23_combo_of_CG06-09_8_20_14_all_35_9]
MPNQLTEQKYGCIDEQRNEIHKALIKEYESLSDRASEQKIKLYNGILQQTLAEKYIYKFSLPKEPERKLEPDKPYILSIDGNTIKGSITAIPQDRLEVEITFYENFGRFIPALEIIIDLKDLIDLIDKRIVAIDKEPSKFKTETATFLFNPHPNAQVPILKKQLTHSLRNDSIKLSGEQIAAIDVSLKQKLTIIWGPPGTGKTITLQGVIAELLSNGQKVLFASNTNNAIDELLKGLIEKGKCPYNIFDRFSSEGKIVRIGSGTKDEIKEVFGSWEVAQQKSQEIQSEIRVIQEKIENEQKELKPIQAELKQFEYVKYLDEEIKKLIEKHSSIPSNQQYENWIEYLTKCKRYLSALLKECNDSKDTIIKIGSTAEKLKREKTKLTGINAIVHKDNAEIEETENKIAIIEKQISELSSNFLSSFFSRGKIANLNLEKLNLISKYKELKSNLETYKNQQKTEIENEAELSGQFVNNINLVSSVLARYDFNPNDTIKFFDHLDISLKLNPTKPFWILFGIEQKVIDNNLGESIFVFTEMEKITDKTLNEKYEQSVANMQKQIENNERYKKLCETTLLIKQKEFQEHKNLFSKPETYWNERKERVNQIQKIIEPFQSQLNFLNEKLRNIEKNVIKEAKLICCTLVKLSYDETLAECEFDTLVVDETSMVSLPQLYCTSSLVKERVILCGDHLQLQPISTSQSKVALKWLASSYYDYVEHGGELSVDSDDEFPEIKKKIRRKVRRAKILDKLKDYVSKLSNQHRMPPKVVDLIRLWYKIAGNDLNDEYKIPDDFKQFHLNGHFLSNDSDIFFIDTSSIRTYHSRTADRSPYNLINAAIVAEITRELVENYKVDLKNIRCISPYRAQYQLTSSLLFKFLPEKEYKEKLPNVASTVHKMQGDEAPIIFYDLTDGCQSGFTGFLKTEDFHIHNVAISRSQFKLIFIGDLKKIQKLREVNPKSAFNDILETLLNSAKIIDAKPYKEKIFKQFNEKDLINENIISLTEEQKNSLIILPSQLYYRFLENDINNAKHSILIVSPFVTKTRWNKLKKALLNFKANIDGTITIITRPPDKMFGGDQINMSAVEVLNEFLKQDFIVKVSPKIHSKLVVIDRGEDNAIAYWGSLNPLSFNDTDEINTRLADKGIVEQLVSMSLIGNIYPYKEVPLNKKLLPKHTAEAVKKQLDNFRRMLGGYYSRPFFAICSNDTIEKIIEFLPTNRDEYKLIPQFNRKNFVLWNHLDEIEEIIAPLREYYQNNRAIVRQTGLFDF